MTDLVSSYEGTPVYETRYDPSSPDTLAETIIEAVATVEETPPTGLAPLHDAIDLETLTKFVEHATDASRNPTVCIGISLERWTIFVHGDGRLLVCEPVDEAAGPEDAEVRTRTTADSD